MRDGARASVWARSTAPCEWWRASALGAPGLGDHAFRLVRARRGRGAPRVRVELERRGCGRGVRRVASRDPRRRRSPRAPPRDGSVGKSCSLARPEKRAASRCAGVARRTEAPASDAAPRRGAPAAAPAARRRNQSSVGRGALPPVGGNVDRGGMSDGRRLVPRARLDASASPSTVPPKRCDLRAAERREPARQRVRRRQRRRNPTVRSRTSGSVARVDARPRVGRRPRPRSRHHRQRDDALRRRVRRGSEWETAIA